eukprot:scaffold103_cov147-Skeletonema_menzelii.AAC.5
MNWAYQRAQQQHWLVAHLARYGEARMKAYLLQIEGVLAMGAASVERSSACEGDADMPDTRMKDEGVLKSTILLFSGELLNEERLATLVRAVHIEEMPVLLPFFLHR